LTLFLAMCLDAALGEPKWLWSRLRHPAVVMGEAVQWLDKTLNDGGNRKPKGIIAVAVLVIGAATIGQILQFLPGQIVDIAVLAIILAQRSLADHVRDVAIALSRSLSEGRAAVARIVGRDTDQMTESEVVRAAIESAAENLSDGVIAPIFWFLIAGLPGLLVYKIVNTADSTVGYLTPRHAEFGWASARLDDVLNFIPARLTALLIAAATLSAGLLPDISDDAPAHRSPNAGWPESAMGHGLNISLSGPRRYDGKMTDFPFVNDAGIRELGPHHITEAVRVLWIVWAIVLIPAGLVAWVF
jgi:adenosylcobinamide-phosphate synthase